jgi:hypothetical protein
MAVSSSPEQAQRAALRCAGVSFNGNSDGGNASLITISTAFVTFAPTLAA